MSGCDRPAQVAAVVLGGGLKEVTVGDRVRYEPEEQAKARLDLGYALFQAGSVDCIITTGKHSFMTSVDPAVVGPQTEAQVGRQYLMAKAARLRADHAALPDRDIREYIYYEDQSMDTIGNAWYVKTLCLEPLGIASCVVVTSDYHVERARAVFEWVLGPRYAVDCAAAPSHLVGREREQRDRFERALTDRLKAELFCVIPAGDDPAIARFMEHVHKEMLSRKAPPFPGPFPGFPPREGEGRDASLPPVP